MTDRPELDAWLAEADAALDEDGYGRTWEADAMHARADALDEFPYQPPFQFAFAPAIERAWRVILDFGDAIAACLPALVQLDDQPAAPSPPSPPVARQAPTVRFCPRHGEEIRHGQCRLCQRQRIRQERRRR